MDIKEKIEVMKKIVESLEQLFEKNSKEEADEPPIPDCEHLASLQDDLKEYFKWLLGDKFGVKLSKKQFEAAFVEQHPDLPLPRIFKTDEDEELPEVAVISLLMQDTYHIFLSQRK